MLPAWIDVELASLDLGDKRRNRRAGLILDQLAQIAESTPDACQSNASLEATYRFVNNPAARPEAILQAHNQASIQRTSEHDVVVLAQDTSTVDLTKPERQVRGAGPLESDDKRGLFIHPLYALTEEGLPLGIVDQVIWTRAEIRTNLSKAEKELLRRKMAFEEKESYRWLEMFQNGEQIARATPATHFISVADSECDICEIFAETPDLPENYDYVIRGCHNRALVARGDEDEAKFVDEALCQVEFLCTSEATVSERVAKVASDTRSRRKSRPARVAKIQMRACQVILRGPSRPGGKLPNVRLNVVEAVETDPPAGEEPIRWVLFTSLPISSIVEIQRVIQLYGRRWDIEMYFKTLKSGLGIEKLKYETLDRYLTAMSLMMIVAWRVEQLKGAARFDSDASCEKYFDADEWMPAYMVLHKTQELPLEPPTISEFMLTIAQLGGYLDKKGQGPPGSTTIWRGLRRMEAYAEAFKAFGKAISRCVG